MREFVAVNNLETVTDVRTLKREALMFNRIAVQHLTSFLSNKQVFNDMSDVIRDLEWLLDSGIVFEPKYEPGADIHLDEYKNATESSLRHAIEITSLVLGVSVDELLEACEDEERTSVTGGAKEIPPKVMESIVKSEAFIKHTEMMSVHSLRALSIQLRELHKLDAYPVLPSDIHLVQGREKGKDEVVKVVLHSLPIPDDNTPWEQVIEYRSDPDSQSKFLALRHWMSEVARAELTPDEVELKLERLIDQYQRHMRLHRMKTNVGTLETVVTTGAEFLGDLVSFKWGKAAEALFSLRRRRVALLEGELTAPGNEVAYIVKARETFA